MNKILFTATLLFSLSALQLYAQQQDWVQMMHEKNANFFTIQALFEDAFEGVEDKKGTGWKQFKRWEYYYQNRVDASGNFPAEGHVLTEMQNYYANHQMKSYLTGSGNWTALGPIYKPNNGTGQPNGNGRLNCIAFHPTDPNTIYVGAPSGGFWKSTDNGASWTEYVTGLVRLGVSSIVVHPSNPNIIYIGTGDRDAGDAPGYGVWRSTDGGLTWAAHNTGMGNRTVYEIIMDPTDPNIMIAATNSRIYRTTNGGTSWSQVFSGHSCKDIAIHPTNNNILYASGTNFYRSTNNGASWSQVTSGVPTGASRMALAVSANQPNYVYILAGSGSGLVALSRSTDSGLNFVQRSNSPNILGYPSDGSDTRSQAWYDLVLAADPTDADVIYSGGVNIWKSIDGGQNWTISAHWVGTGADDVHADHHALDFSPHNNHLYNGNDGGLYITTDGGVIWNEFSSGLGIAQIYKIGTAQSVENTVINGYQDNGTAIYYDGPFNTEIGGDGMECIIDPTDASYMYGALYYGDIRRSTDGGASFSQIADDGTNGINESGGWVTPYALDPNNPARMYIGYKNVWRSNDVKSPAANAVAWTRISNLGGGNMVDIAVAPSNSDVLYVSKSSSGNRLFKTTNATAGSPTFSSLQAGLPSNSNVKDIAIDPLDPNHVFIAQGNNIYESTNGGTSWTDVSGTLPNISLNTIVIDHNSAVEAMYVGMDVGVYYKDNTMADWVLYNTGLANVEVTELEIYANPAECKSKLFAATYGQGLWVSDLKDPGGLAPIACFEASTLSACVGMPIAFTSNSDYSPTSWTWTISPATFNFLNGTNANSENPEIAFTAAGTYTISLNANNSSGSDLETKTNYITVSSASTANSFNDDFESYAACATTSNCGATNCAITGSWNNLANGVDDDIDFRIDQGGTPSTGTGPSVDFNPGTATGNYAYTEASSCFGQLAILESACILLDIDYDWEIAYHMTGNAVGELHFDIFTNGAWAEDIVPAISADQGASWLTQTIDLSPFTGETVRLRIRAITGSGFQSDIAIDDILFRPQTILPTTLLSFKSDCKGNGSVLLEWEIAENDLNEYIEIQKFDQNTENWEILGQQEVTEAVKYRFEDHSALIGENLYRLAIVNPNGNKKYSDMVVSVCDYDKNSIQLFPNPFEETTTLQLYSHSEGTMPYHLTNLLGQELFSKNLEVQKGVNNWTISLEGLPQGVYLLYINNMRQNAIKLIKQ
jgi:photosystem II stability/assembly factor-like uncharacterized protein